MSFLLASLIIQTADHLFRRNVSNVSSTRSKLGREDIKWSELLSHFRNVQNKHEKTRRQAAGGMDDMTLPLPGFSSDSGSSVSAPPPPPAVNGSGPRPGMRRRVTGGTAETPLARPPSRTLSPLNPRTRGGSNSLGQPSGLRDAVMPGPTSPTFNNNVQGQRQSKRTLSLSRRT